MSELAINPEHQPDGQRVPRIPVLELVGANLRSVSVLDLYDEHDRVEAELARLQAERLAIEAASLGHDSNYARLDEDIQKIDAQIKAAAAHQAELGYALSFD